ncbi:MAG: hypothetical protein JKX69_04625 [Rhodobacteraceae bacterium]|nr:hypothetical protein [Paracoccaceae bacterium]
MTGLRTVLTAIAVSAAMVVPAVAQTTQVLKIVNHSGQTLTHIWASAQSNTSWENELLGTRVLRNRQYYQVTIRNVVDCSYDIRMEFANGQRMTDVINICLVDEYTVNR